MIVNFLYKHNTANNNYINTAYQIRENSKEDVQEESQTLLTNDTMRKSKLRMTDITHITN